ncbi:MAG: DUF262 domain-containing protein [Candidatus Electryonea clarkiae]|nr:DUF262 domain-containing protein [Candidatus Electryonea clarkiae]MDP8314266.1 DUF262 domain-containing protein [Candidatus Celaenobacter antarcticus]
MMTSTMQKTFYKVSDFISWQKAGTLTLTPYFQRRSVWKPGAKSYLIDTIVRGFPIPIIFLRDSRTDLKIFEPMREVIDGQQRLRTVLSYVDPGCLKDFKPDRDAFVVKRTHNKEIAGKTFSELDNELKRTILDYEFSVHVMSSGVDDREIIQIFRRMNATNYILTRQEHRNALFYGEFKSSAYQLAAEQLRRWTNWKTFNKDNISRMEEVELTSELLVMMIDEKISGKSSAKIDNAYKKYDEEFPQRDEIENRYRTVMDTIDNNFGHGSNIAFFKKTLVYTFISIIYDYQYPEKPLSLKVTPRKLSPNITAAIKLCSDRIKERTAPEDVLNASDRRTTNPKERTTLFNYLKKRIENA